MFAEHSGFAAWEALLATSSLLVEDSSVDEVTFAGEGSFVVITVGKAPGIVDYFHVAVWQVFASNWVSKLELVVERQLELLSFDYRSSATFHVPFDEAFERDCVLAGSDDWLGWRLVALPSPIDAG